MLLSTFLNVERVGLGDRHFFYSQGMSAGWYDNPTSTELPGAIMAFPKLAIKMLTRLLQSS